MKAFDDMIISVDLFGADGGASLVRMSQLTNCVREVKNYSEHAEPLRINRKLLEPMRATI